MVNVNKLRGRMVEQEVNADKMAELLGINRSTFYRKLEIKCTAMYRGFESHPLRQK